MVWGGVVSCGAREEKGREASFLFFVVDFPKGRQKSEVPEIPSLSHKPLALIDRRHAAMENCQRIEICLEYSTEGRS